MNRSPSLIFWPGSPAYLHSRIRIAVGKNHSTAVVYPSAKHYPVLNTQSTTLHVCCRHAPRLPPLLPVPGFSCIWPFRTEIALVSPNRSVGTDLVDLHQSEPGMGDVRTRTRSASDAPRSTKRALLDAESETNTSRRDRRNAVESVRKVSFLRLGGWRFGEGWERTRLNSRRQMLQKSAGLGKPFSCPRRKCTLRSTCARGIVWRCHVERVAESSKASSRKVTLRAQRKASLQVVRPGKAIEG